uniref:NADP-dependent alcohol dehydrogenase n=1 Tax=Candidatus Kentrum eta TaxID=2126337 RepID=A0A450VJA1_9GAMM|nr:MAG: NADP-dependent alcohol dehydrogenase [Candidatus Kentron sp. H]VFK01242.1 MAG: NADP-dependent alcohol dehydrogenase [Candidatus Kentron sp. H]VFK04883.1 MAG: NADP-dependent alcohol dehydrogenase [Candidatus Kentron sp. H]
MLDFTYQNPVKILFGKGKIRDLAHEIPSGATILLLYGEGSIKKNGVHAQAIKALKGRDIVEFGGIEPNPSYEKAMAAVAIIREKGIDFILGVGGGSVIDAAKFIAAAARFTDGDPWRILTGAPVRDALPLGAILTLPATGSEMNADSVMTRRSTADKLYFASPLVYPKFSILDPTTTYSLPPRQIANGIVDAFIHVMEQYLTFPVDAPLQDRMAEGILQTLIEEGPKALERPTDYNVRANIMWCATLALNGLICQGVPEDWSTHMIGHEITALHGLDHARTLAIVLPAVMDMERDRKRDKILQYAERIWGIDSAATGAEETIDRAIAETRAFFEGLGVKTRLGDYGIDGASIPAIIHKLEEHGRTALGEHGDIGPDTSREILERCL